MFQHFAVSCSVVEISAVVMCVSAESEDKTMKQLGHFHFLLFSCGFFLFFFYCFQYTSNSIQIWFQVLILVAQVFREVWESAVGLPSFVIQQTLGFFFFKSLLFTTAILSQFLCSSVSIFFSNASIILMTKTCFFVSTSDLTSTPSFL